MGVTEKMGPRGGAPGRLATAAVQSLELVGIETPNLSLRYRFDDRPVVPAGPAETDKNGLFFTPVEELRYLRPEIVKGGIGVLFEGHGPVPDALTRHISQDPAYGFEG